MLLRAIFPPFMGQMVKKGLLVLYSLWAYGVFGFILIAGALGYGLVALFTPSKGRERRLLRVNNGIAAIWGLLCGIQYEIEYPSSLKKDGVYVFTPNHSSTLDMLVGSYAFRHGMRFLVKKELKNVPFMGFMFSLIGVFVDRSDPESRKKSREVLKSWAAKGVSFCVFPEGTRNRTTEPLGRFYQGAFDAAISAGIPIAPIVFIGNRQLMPMNSRLLRPGKMKAIYLEPIPTCDLSSEDAGILRDQVFRAMYNAIVAEERQFVGRAALGPDDPVPVSVPD